MLGKCSAASIWCQVKQHHVTVYTNSTYAYSQAFRQFDIPIRHFSTIFFISKLSHTCFWRLKEDESCFQGFLQSPAQHSNRSKTTPSDTPIHVGCYYVTAMFMRPLLRRIKRDIEGGNGCSLTQLIEQVVEVVTIQDAWQSSGNKPYKQWSSVHHQSRTTVSSSGDWSWDAWRRVLRHRYFGIPITWVYISNEWVRSI